MSDSDYNRKGPSQRYKRLLRQYQQLHQQGDKVNQIAAEQTFMGQSLVHHVQKIRVLVQRHVAKHILDYGCGKGKQYAQPLVKDESLSSDPLMIRDYWGVDDIHRYDPGFEPFSELPSKPFDGVISTDVLEHCPEEDLEWILDEIFSYAKKFVYVNVACYEAKKLLPNGENAHSTVKDPQWWTPLIDRTAGRYPGLEFEVTFHVQQDGKRLEYRYANWN